MCARLSGVLNALMGVMETWCGMRWKPGQLQTEGGPIHQDGAAMVMVPRAPECDKGALILLCQKVRARGAPASSV